MPEVVCKESSGGVGHFNRDKIYAGEGKIAGFVPGLLAGTNAALLAVIFALLKMEIMYGTLLMRQVDASQECGELLKVFHENQGSDLRAISLFQGIFGIVGGGLTLAAASWAMFRSPSTQAIDTKIANVTQEMGELRASGNVERIVVQDAEPAVPPPVPPVVAGGAAAAPAPAAPAAPAAGGAAPVPAPAPRRLYRMGQRGDAQGGQTQVSDAEIARAREGLSGHQSFDEVVLPGHNRTYVLRQGQPGQELAVRSRDIYDVLYQHEAEDLMRTFDERRESFRRDLGTEQRSHSEKSSTFVTLSNTLSTLCNGVAGVGSAGYQNEQKLYEGQAAVSQSSLNLSQSISGQYHGNIDKRTNESSAVIQTISAIGNANMIGQA